MAQKWNLQDIRPAGSLQDRSQSEQMRRMRQDVTPRRQPVRSETQLDDDLSSIDIIDGKNARRKHIIVSVCVSILIVAAAFLVNVMLGGAEVTVYPKFKDTSVQATFITYKNPQVGELSYELLTLDATGERQVKATGQETVSERAQGEILIYNTKTATQRLIKNTRFESPDGLIYRINESVEVPAATKSADGKLASGVISVKVFADGAGEQYNIEPSRFTIPGLKGKPEFDTMYGESTVAFTGGFEGSKYKIDETELQKSLQELHLDLRDGLLKRLETERPAGFVLYEGAVTISYESQPATSYGESLATIKEKAYLSVPLFKENEIAEYLAKNTIAGYEDEPVALTDPLSLTFGYTVGTTTTSDIRDKESLSFSLKGTTQIVWQFDESKLRQDLITLQKSALPNVLSGYPAIERANAVVRPFWRQKFPDNADEIKVKTIIGAEAP